MGATEEQMNLIAHSGIDGVSYVLILYSLAFMVFLFSNMLIHLYDRLANPVANKGYSNGHIRLNERNAEEGRVREAEEFELEGLTSDDEAEEGHRMLQRTSVDATPAANKNNENSTH